jgi:hypothetical protein
VQRTWSNSAAQASHDPCSPSLPGEVYFNSAPVLTDPVSLPVFSHGQIVTSVGTKGLLINPLQSKTVELDLYSDGPTDGDWAVSAVDQSTDGGALDFQFDKTTGHNGDKVQLTVTVLQMSSTQREQFLIVSQLGSQTNVWPVVVQSIVP